MDLARRAAQGPSWRSVLADAVVQVRHAGTLDDPRVLQLDRRTTEVVEKADALVEEHGHEVYLDPIEQPRVQEVASGGPKGASRP